MMKRMAQRSFSSQELLAFVRKGEPEMATAIASLLPKSNLIRCQGEAYLDDATPMKRLLGLVRVEMELAWAADPEAALRLLAPLVIAVEQAIAADGHIKPPLARDIRNSLRSAQAFATLQIGRFDECLAITDWLLADTEATMGKPAGWLLDTRYEALIRTFRIVDAGAFRMIQPTDEGDPTRRTAELDDMLTGLVPIDAETGFLEPRPDFDWVPDFDWFNESRDRLLAWVVRQREADQALFRSFAAFGLNNENWSLIAERFEEAAAAIASIALVADDRSIQQADRDDVIRRCLHAHSTAVREIQAASAVRPRTLHDNRHVLHYAAMVMALKTPTPEETAAAIGNATSASQWSAHCGDRYGEAMALWTLGRLQERSGERFQALEAYASVYARLLALRAELTGPAMRGMLAESFRTLIPRLTLLALEAGEERLAFDALDFRRGLAVAGAKPGVETAGPEIPDASYYAISVLGEYGVFGSLATADGVRSVARLAIEASDLDRLVARCCPDTWRQGVMRVDHSPRQALSPIMEPLERAALAGRIADGSHIGVALDHPLHAAPIHYLCVGGQMAFMRYGFSRVTSFQDFQQLARAPKAVPRAATTIFIPACDTEGNEAHEMSFAQATSPLSRNVAELSCLSGTAADEGAVLDALTGPGIVHVHAHGIFPDEEPEKLLNPVTGAGILVAARGLLPDRSRPEAYLLRTKDVVDRRVLRAAHVSLSTCVSGLGRPGRAGDMLGVEFALRLGGVGSVIACHWYIPHATAAVFFARFYEEWLGHGLRRGEAWRVAVQSLAEAAATESDAAAMAGPFSLFGEWS